MVIASMERRSLSLISPAHVYISSGHQDRSHSQCPTWDDQGSSGIYRDFGEHHDGLIGSRIRVPKPSSVAAKESFALDFFAFKCTQSSNSRVSQRPRYQLGHKVSGPGVQRHRDAISPQGTGAPKR